ncbi:MAG: hypothetical protein IJD45_06655 [Clostridia bacterium]|nr:hypothetical protein [Clostridia bacterium]
MTFIQFITTLLELSAFIGLIWCIFHEDTLVAFEERVFAAIRRKRLRVVKARRTHSYNI